MMSSISLHTFDGGIHPPENKAQSTQTPIRTATLASELIVPISQHIGAAAKPIVAVGERVLKGQCVAEAVGFISVPVHAPSSGIVSAIEPRPIAHASGLTELCIVIKTDGLDEWINRQRLLTEDSTQTLTDLNAAVLIEHIRQHGIAGMGGAGFPTAVKMSSQHHIHTLIINGAECEPYITADDMLMRERAHEVILGAQILQHILKAERCIIAVEDNKPNAIESLMTALNAAKTQTTQTMMVVSIPTKYPSGGEKQLIKIITGNEVPHAGLPADIGVVCQNVGTATAVYRAVYLGEPLISRITTLTGNAIHEPGNWDVLIGTPITHLLAQADYHAQKQERVILGGPMMGFTLPHLHVPIVKTTNCLLAPTLSELPLNDFAMACIRCGLCADACPQDLLPQQLYWFSKGQEHAKAEQHNLFDCIECGACSYVCPSHIPLVQYYRHTKGAILEERTAHEKSERARIRFEDRIARHERMAAEKEEKRRARAEAAAAAQAAKAAESVTTSSETTSTNDNAADSAKRKILAQEDRVMKMQESCNKARAEQLPTVEKLEQALLKQQEKLQQLQQELAAIEAEQKG